MHCPLWSVFLHCPSLAPCYVLPFWAMLCLPLLVSVLCTDHNGHCAYALPFWGTMLCTAFLGHCALHCPSWAMICTAPSWVLCSVLPLWGTVHCTAFLWHHCLSGTVCHALSIMVSVFALPFLGTVLCTALLGYALPASLGQCALH